MRRGRLPHLLLQWYSGGGVSQISVLSGTCHNCIKALLLCSPTDSRAKRVRDVLKRRHGQRCDYTPNLGLKCNTAGWRRLQATESAPAEVPSEWLTYLVLDKSGIIGYNWAVRSNKALRACRVRYARKSSFGFVRSSCLWFLPPSAVEKSRSQRVEELGSRKANRRPHLSGRSLGDRGPFPDFPTCPMATREPGERAGSHDSKGTQNITNEASKLLKTHDSVGKRTQNEPKTKPDLSAKCTD